MKNRVLLAASLVLMSTLASAQTLKWDLKPMPEGFSVPSNQLRVHDGMLIPQISMVWVNPNDQNNFEVTVIPRSLYRKANGPLCPAPGYEWLEPDNLQNFDVRPVQSTAPSSADDTATDDNSSDEDKSHPQSASQAAPADSSQELPPCVSVQPTGVRILNPEYVPCKPTDLPPAVAGDQNAVSPQPGAPASPGHEHEPNQPASGSNPGPDRSPAFIPLGGAAAPAIGQELQHLNGVIEQRDADMDYIQNSGKSGGNNGNAGNGEASDGNGGANGGGNSSGNGEANGGGNGGGNAEANGGGNGGGNGEANGGGNGGSEGSNGGGDHDHGGAGDSMK